MRDVKLQCRNSVTDASGMVSCSVMEECISEYSQTSKTGTLLNEHDGLGYFTGILDGWLRYNGCGRH